MIAGLVLAMGLTVAQHDSGVVTTPDGVKLYYERVGSGMPVVIVPGRFLVARDFGRLAHGRTLVFYDMRNRGRSSAVADTAAISIRRDVEDLETIRRHVGAERVSLIGFSYLGYMVMLYTMAHPDRVDRVVQLGPVPWHFDATYPDSLTAVRHPAHPAPADTLKLHAWADSGYETSRPREYCAVAWAVDRVGLVGDPVNVPKLGVGWCDMPNEWPVNSDRHLKYHIATIAKLTTSASDVAAIDVPVLTIHGTWDRNAPYGSGVEWARTLPHARLIPVSGAGHFSWLDAPNVVFPAIDRFLSQ